MPIYAFVCSACGHDFDRLQRLSDADPTTCPACGAEGTIGRQLTAPQFRLAGGGWYETDFKKDGDKKRNLVDKGDGASPGGGASAGSASPGGGASAGSASPAAAPASPASSPRGTGPTG
ncbi:MAG TPA: transcriptional regulator [Xanthomonadaceae bacterium]|jgi:putative FmdB family regulatory protein|nr:transcriptional regulator [Xanthomonadaceae bacterium]